MPLSGDFKAIKDCTNPGDYVSIVGIIVSIKEAKKTGGPDWVLDFTLQDDFTSGSIGGDASISCRVFRPKPDQLPKAASTGDVVILRKFRLSAWKHRIDCVNDKFMSSMHVFPGNRIPHPDLSQSYQAGGTKLPCESTMRVMNVTPAEQMAVICMKHASSGSAQQVQQHAATVASKATASKKRALVKDLEFNRFYEIYVQVLNTYYHNGKSQVDMKVTDYTENKNLFYYPDPEKEDAYMVNNRKREGPFGYLTLNVTLYDRNADWSRENVGDSDYVHIRNLRARVCDRGHLEGVVHQDRLHTEQVDIRLLKNTSDIEEINKRREAYEKQRGGDKTAFEAIRNAPETSAKASLVKKQAKKDRLRADKEAEQQELEQKAREWEFSRSGGNANIRAAYPEMKLSTISDIVYNPHLAIRTPAKMNTYTLPFVNCRHRSRLRVVDVFPPEPALFAHSMTDPDWTTQPKKHSSTSAHTKERWEWGFVLLVEDAEIPRGTVSEKLRVIVNNEAAQYLLNMSASDLKNQPRVLKQVEEKLFILWGNLMELKTELRVRGSDLPLPPGDNRLQNKPFDACIEEYGCVVPLSKEHPFGYQRMHKLAHTTIQGYIGR